MRRILLTLATLALLTVPATASAAGNPTTCEGYPEPRVFLESQSGWSDFEGTAYGDAEHSHAAACFPYLQTLNGTVQIDVVSKMHNLRGQYLRKVRIAAASNQGGGLIQKDWGVMRQCLADDCTFVTTMMVNTDLLGSGRWEFRIHSEVRKFAAPSLEPANLATNGWLACVRTCDGTRQPQAVRWPGTEGRGWYDSDGLTKGYIVGQLMEQIPSGPVSGTWTPLVRIVGGSNEGINPVDGSFASIDPSFHADPADPGMVVLDQAGEFRNSRLSIDTTKLANGPHKLMLRANGTTGFAGELWGAMVIPFTVDNGAGA